MKKLFLLIPAMLLAATVSYAEYRYPDAATENSLRSAVSAASAGDVIVLEGTYGNTTSGYIEIGKNLTFQVAEGKTATIKPEAPIQVKNGASVKFIGVKFDGSSIGSYDYFIRFDDDNANNELELDNCEFTSVAKFCIKVKDSGKKAKSCIIKNCNFHDNTNVAFYNNSGTVGTLQIKDSEFSNFTTTYVIENHGSGSITTLDVDGCEFYNNASYNIYAPAGSSMNSCAINNCYFHNNTRSACYIGFNATTQACNALTVENSTFADFSGDYNVIHFSGPAEVSFTVNASLSVNHCTFYKHPRRAIYWEKSSDVSIKNCIFSQPASISYKAVDCVSGSTVSHCLSYKNSDAGSVTTDDSDITGNPYFINAYINNYDFTPASTSPAHNAGDDSKDLGDYLHWTSDDSAHPTTRNITAGTDAIRAAVEAVWPGENIVLATGTYNESKSIALDKEITIKAANAANVIVKPVKNIAISNTAEVTIQNIKFDGSDQSDVSNFIYAADATSNSLSVEGCEFYNFSNAVIYAADSRLISSCTVNNCQFYDNTHSCIGLKNSAAANLTVSNSTFNNNDASGVGEGNGIGIVESKTATGTMLVDHCTFYNCKVLNTDFGITKVASPNATVSNCIFAMPTSTDDLRTVYFPSGLAAGTTVTNCIMHNFTYDSNIGVPSRSGSIKTNCYAVDPLFINTATGFAVKGDWSTGEISPAREAATDGTCLGDPRWYTDEVLPSTNFASAYDLVGTKGLLTGDVELNASNHIKYKGTSTPGTVKWKLHVTKNCAISAVAKRESESTSGCTLTLTVKDADDNNVGAITAARSDSDDDINFPGTIYFSEEGDYTIILTNSVEHSGSILEKIILSYAGGAAQNLTNSADFETNLDEAWFSSNGTRADGKISFPGASITSEWVRWNLHVANSDYYDITVTFDKGSADNNVGVKIYDSSSTIFDKHVVAVGSQTGATSPKTLGRAYIPAGDYTMEYTNPVSWSSAKLISVQAVAFVAPTIDLPATLKANDAIMSELASAASADVDETALYFVPSGKEGQILDQWAQWKVSVAADASTYLFTMEVSSSGTTQTYKISILDSETNEIDYCTRNPGSGDKTLKHYFYFAEAGTYYVKVQNTTKWSNGHIVSFAASDTPVGMITINEEATSNEDWVDKVNDKNTYDVQIIRTLKANMYNTFCLPFRVPDDMCKDLFGSDVEIYTLDEATVDDNILNLELHKSSDVWQGTPVFIKPSRNIVNPVFSGVEFKAAAPSASIGTNANFTGSFVATTLGPDPNILFLAQDNMLYYPQDEIPILGMRGWLVLHDSPALISPRRANFILPDKMPTAIEIVNGDILPLDKTMKVIENGQLIIIRDGVRYNVMGVRVK